MGGKKQPAKLNLVFCLKNVLFGMHVLMSSGEVLPFDQQGSADTR